MSDHDTWNMFAAAALQGLFARGYTQEGAIENAPIIADALLAESKKREKFEPEYDDEGWIRHKGDGMPVALDAIIQLEGGSRVPASSVNWNWAFRYRIATKAGVTK